MHYYAHTVKYSEVEGLGMDEKEMTHSHNECAIDVPR